MCFLHVSSHPNTRVLRSLRCRLQVCPVTAKLELQVEWCVKCYWIIAFQLSHAFVFNGHFYCVSFLELRLAASWQILIKPWEWRLGYVHVKFCCFQLGLCFEIIISYLSAHEGLELHMLPENCVWPFWFLNQVNSLWVTHLRYLNLSLPLIIHDYVILWVSFSHCRL